MPLLRRRLCCHYCNTYSRNDQAGIPRTWRCPYCDAVNHLDERGEITDPPAADASPAPPVQYISSRSPTPAMPAPTESPFCDVCQRNQLLVNKTLAEYLPDEDDPEYEKYAASVDEYRAELEDRYPQVCDNCINRVQDQIRATGYAAKADHLRRVLEHSKRSRDDSSTPRQFWTLAIVQLARWAYVSSVAIGLLWHIFGVMVAPGNAVTTQANLIRCLKEIALDGSVEEQCLLSPYMLQFVKYALIADLLTLWWNPKLKQKTNRLGGHMRGLLFVWFLRTVTLLVRYLGFRNLDNVDSRPNQLQQLHYIHGIIFVVLSLSTIVSWKSVRIDYQSTKPLMQPLNAHLPSAPGSAEKAARSIRKAQLPNNTSFDTMAASFTSSFPIGEPGEPSIAYPPSPTLTSVSSTTIDSDIGTPYQRTATTRDADDMDWTPTKKRFASHAPLVLPSQWAKPSPPQLTPAREPHSIFSKPDPNPFRHKVPPAPKGPAESKVNPWKPGLWAPPLKETTPNFFKEDKKGMAVDEGNGLQGIGVPRNVQRQADLFASPKLKYDNYGKMKETGLENSFNDLFSK